MHGTALVTHRCPVANCTSAYQRNDEFENHVRAVHFCDRFGIPYSVKNPKLSNDNLRRILRRMGALNLEVLVQKPMNDAFQEVVTVVRQVEKKNGGRAYLNTVAVSRMRKTVFALAGERVHDTVIQEILRKRSDYLQLWRAIPSMERWLSCH